MARLSTFGPCSCAGARFAAACSFPLHFVPSVFLLGSEMSEDRTPEHAADGGSGGDGDPRSQLDKAVVKEALSELLGELPAFRSLMKLPPPGSAQGSQGAEGALSLPGPSGSGTGKVVEVASVFMYARLLTTLPAALSGLG